MSEASVLLQVEQGIATVTLNRPAQLNALDEPTRYALLMALVTAVRDSSVAVIVLTGQGRGFCVGQDLAASAELEDCHDCVERTYNPLVEHLANLDKPIIAAVNGPAVGAGMGLALGCDAVLMAEGSFFSCAFGKVGLIPDSGTTYYLSRVVGHYRAFELATSGRRVDAVEAVALGLANTVVPAEELLACAYALARQWMTLGAKSLSLTKRLIRRAAQIPLAEAIEAEALAQGVCGATENHRRLRQNFVTRR